MCAVTRYLFLQYMYIMLMEKKYTHTETNIYYIDNVRLNNIVVLRS